MVTLMTPLTLSALLPQVCSIPADKEIGEPMLDYLGESNFISDQTASVVLDFVLPSPATHAISP